ncbi:MAG: SDR family oxidoreductase [Jannaschia sp.]
MSPVTDPSIPRLAVTGSTGRVARLLKPFLPGTVWLNRGEDAAAIGGCDTLVCLAGVTGSPATGLDGNSDVALEALDAAIRFGIRRVFLMSSAAVYGRASGLLTVGVPLSPATPYGEAKARMEATVARWRCETATDVAAICCRLGNVAGADGLLGGLAPGMTPDLHIWPDGTSPRRSYIGPRSLAQVVARLAATDDLPEILNIAAPGAVAMADLLEAAGRTWRPVPAPADAIPEVWLDTAPLERLVPLPMAAATPQGIVAEWREAIA